MAGSVVRKTESVSIRMTPETKRVVQKLAEQDHRTVTNWLEVLILREVEKREQGAAAE